MNAESVSIVVPNWNGRHYLDACLTSVFNQDLAPHGLEVILVDNASSDGSVKFVSERFPQVKMVLNPTNLGFTPAINQGADTATGSLLFLLNNDTVLQPGTLATLVTTLLAAPPEVGGVQPLLLRASDPSLIDSAGIALERHFRARDDLHGQSRGLAPTQPVEVWGLCAGAALLRRSVFLECGGFDPDYFAEWDDVDFSLRARWLGYTFLLQPQAIVHHHRSPSSQRDPAAKIARHRRNQLWTVMKALPCGWAVRQMLYRFGRDLGMIPHFLRHHELSAMAGVWRNVIAGRAAMQSRRRELVRRARLTPAEMSAQLKQFMQGNPRR